MNTEILAIHNLLDHLFADKKAIYIEDITINIKGHYEVFWCMDFTLHVGQPEWNETTITRKKLLNFIRDERLNHWEAFRYDERVGCVQPFTNITHDVDIFLNENYMEVIKEYLAYYNI
jgi:hypothetical protein